MRSVHVGPVVGSLAQLAMLAVLAATVGLDAAGWVVGAGCAVATAGLVVRAQRRAGVRELGPADRVTLVRAGLVGLVAALVADAYAVPVPVPLVVGLATVALVLDAVDGQVARRTGTVTAFGARFDMEVDAFLLLVLSAYVARSAGAWVLLIGAARYVFVAAGWLLPWLRGPLPVRTWPKVVAALQGVVLAVAAAGVLPRRWTDLALVGALLLLAQSFGHDVLWLRRRAPAPARRSRTRTALGAVAMAAAAALGWFALVGPVRLGGLTPDAFVRVPLEAVVFVVVVGVLPARLRTPVAAAAGLALGVLALLRVVDLGFFAALDRPFNPVTDWGNLGPAVGVLGDSIGRTRAEVAVAAVGFLVVAALALATAGAVRLAGLVGRHRTVSLRAVLVIGSAWTLLATLGVQIVPGTPVASTSAVALAADQVGQVRAGLLDQRTFTRASAVDRFGDVPGAGLLTGLRGKDVIVAFVESYGRVAVQDSWFAPGVDAVLDDGTRRLHAAGFSARSAFLTSPTFGGISWLAHSTLQSGLWIDNQQRYDDLLGSDRLTLSGAFHRAGWRTVGDVPSNGRPWPRGARFYHYDRVYAAADVGYAGPKFSYAAMPDQYVLAAFRRRELAAPHRPVMAEIDLVSSHTPWAPLPRPVPWTAVGDGSVFDPMPALGASPAAVWRSAHRVQAGYATSIRYTLSTLVSFVQTYPDPNLVLVVLGDHQPASIVSGEGASHDVPVSVIAHDPAVLDRISGWGWQAGLRPRPDAPVWRMDAFRDRFLTAFGPRPTTLASSR